MGVIERNERDVHAGLVQRLFLVRQTPSHSFAACLLAATLPAGVPSLCMALCAAPLRALREPRVSPEPLAVLEEQDGCDRDQHCRSTVLGQ